MHEDILKINLFVNKSFFNHCLSSSNVGGRDNRFTEDSQGRKTVQGILPLRSRSCSGKIMISTISKRYIKNRKMNYITPWLLLELSSSARFLLQVKSFNKEHRSTCIAKSVVRQATVNSWLTLSLGDASSSPSISLIDSARLSGPIQPPSSSSSSSVLHSPSLLHSSLSCKCYWHS